MLAGCLSNLYHRSFIINIFIPYNNLMKNYKHIIFTCYKNVSIKDYFPYDIFQLFSLYIFF